MCNCEKLCNIAAKYNPKPDPNPCPSPEPNSNPNPIAFRIIFRIPRRILPYQVVNCRLTSFTVSNNLSYAYPQHSEHQ